MINKETLEEAAERLTYNDTLSWENSLAMESFKLGAKWQQQNSYSEKEVLVLLHKRDKHSMDKSLTFSSWQAPKEWFEQFKNK